MNRRNEPGFQFVLLVWLLCLLACILFGILLLAI